MKSENVIKLTVRLNKTDPRHQRALALIHSSGCSITNTVVDAVITANEAGSFIRFKQDLEKMICSTIDAALTGRTVAAAQTVRSESDYIDGGISDEDFDIADDFMSHL